jgi:hypothetical protein
MIVIFLMALLILAAIHVHITDDHQHHNDRIPEEMSYSYTRTTTETLVRDGVRILYKAFKPPEYCRYRQHCTYSSTDG